MNQQVTPDELRRTFTFPTWNPNEQYWDEFLRAVADAYAHHRAAGAPTGVKDQAPQDPKREVQVDAHAH